MFQIACPLSLGDWFPGIDVRPVGESGVPERENPGMATLRQASSTMKVFFIDVLLITLTAF